VDWSPKGVGAILSQKEGKLEKVVAYVSKSLTKAQIKFHPMKGESYVLIWGIMHFRQYLHRNHFILRTDHKPLEWLVIVSYAHGKRGRWIDMLQDFSFKILDKPGLKHTNVDALSRNLVGPTMNDDDFNEKIQDIGGTQTEHLRLKMIFSLFKLAKVQNGSILGDKKKSFFNIMNVVLASITYIVPEVISSICLMLYQRTINKTSWLHMLKRMMQQMKKEVRVLRIMM
jgi:hypothetical protein